jgi:hypothetical protein
MEKNEKIILGIVIVTFVGMIVVGLMGNISSNDNEKDIQSDIVGVGNLNFWVEPNFEGTMYATQWFESVSGKQYKSATIRFDLHKDDKVYMSENTTISLMNGRSNAFVTFKTTTEPDYVTATVIKNISA